MKAGFWDREAAAVLSPAVGGVAPAFWFWLRNGAGVDAISVGGPCVWAIRDMLISYTVALPVLVFCRRFGVRSLLSLWLVAALFVAHPSKMAAYGEIGLDYHWDTVPRERQREAFAAQIAFALSLRPEAPLPLILHNRDALADVLAVLKESQTPAPIVMHCFTGDTETARQCLDAGCFLGIGGVATFKKSEAIRAAIAYAPLERLLLETDCPYLAPQFQRGRRNEPSYLPAICETVAAAKSLTTEEVAAATTATAKALFRMA